MFYFFLLLKYSELQIVSICGFACVAAYQIAVNQGINFFN